MKCDSQLAAAGGYICPNCLATSDKPLDQECQPIVKATKTKRKRCGCMKGMSKDEIRKLLNERRQRKQ